MKVHLALTLAGIFALDNESNIINTRPFKMQSNEVAKKIILLENGELPPEVSDLLKDHKEDEIFVQNAMLGKALVSNDFKVTLDITDLVIQDFHLNIVNHLLNMGMFKQAEDYRSFLRETTILLTKNRVREAADKRDRLIVHTIESIDDLDKTLNLFSNRLREFYGMHFPELVDAIENHLTFAKIVSETGNRSNINEKLLIDDISLPKDKAMKLLEIRETTMGSELLDQDIQIIKDQAKIVVELFIRRQALEKWMEVAMKEIAPNICGVISPLLGARLISLAGSLKDLALCPSSKIQILGAEKALYRTIKTGAPPPKHGVIYQDPRLNQAKWWQRGKIARIISGRISIAARMDFFEASDNSEKLSSEINEKINEILVKYPDPPDKPKKLPKPLKPSSRKTKEFSKKRTK